MVSIGQKYKYLIPSGLLALGIFIIIRFIPALLAGFLWAYCINMIVQYFHARKIYKSWLIYLVLFIISIFIIILVAVVAIAVQYEVRMILNRLPDFFSRISSLILSSEIEKNFTALMSKLPEYIDENISSIIPILKPTGIFIIGKASHMTGGFFHFTYSISVFCISSMVFIGQWNSICSFILSCIPLEYRSTILLMHEAFEKIFTVFLFNQITMAFMNSTIIYLLVSILGCPYSTAIFALSFFGSFIPYFGCITGIISVIAITMIHGALNSYTMISLAIIFIISYTIESYLLVPYFLGESIGIHPLIIMCALPLSLQFFGIGGVFLCIPIILYIKIFIQYILENYAIHSLKKNT